MVDRKGGDMLFVVVGVVLLFLKSEGMTSVAYWPWWGVLLPFALAIVWWYWADEFGYTKRKAVEKEDRRRQNRIAKQRQVMGLPTARGR
jgi:small Trp-rich protein